MSSLVLVLCLVTSAIACWPEPTAHPVSASSPGECVTCHLDDYQAALEPLHEGNFPRTCEQCHSTRAWRPAISGGHPEKRFPINDGQNHASLDCNDCHDRSRGADGKDNVRCVSCHLGSHVRQSMDAQHAAVQGYPKEAAADNFCLSCHPSGKTEGFVHPAERFPLADQHANLTCDQCHDSSQTPNDKNNTDCVGCHLGVHARSVVDSVHGEVGGYPAQSESRNFCLACHPSGTAAVLGHPDDRFPRAAHHAGLECGDCHDRSRGPDGVNNTDCVGCHLGVHARSAVDSIHVAVADYPLNQAEVSPNFCLSCHADGTAPAASHPDDRFPLLGPHADHACLDCHDRSRGADGPDNVNCAGCHLGVHARSAIDPRHRDVPGYPTGAAPPNYCLGCHPAGTAMGSIHPEESFPLSSPHDVDCADCHDRSVGLDGAGNTDCIGCHTGDHEFSKMSILHGPVPNFPQTPPSANFCLTCHARGQQ